jgi:drug/metabolite transporter (DMT)-like permease
MPPSTPTRSGVAYLALAAAGTLWGTTFLFGKMALDELAVGHMLLYRFVIGSIAFAPIAWTSWRPIRRAHWSMLAWAAALGVPIQFLVQFEGLARTTVAHASLMVAALPILLAVGAATFDRERLARWEWAALAVSTAGAVLIASGGGTGSAGPTLVGDGLVVLSLVAGVGWILITKRLTRDYPAGMVSIATMWIGTALLAAWSLATDGLPPVTLHARTWLAVAAQGVLATMGATLLWNWGVARVPAGRAGVFVNLEPIVGAALGVSVLGEALPGAAILGGLLILGAATAIALRPSVNEAPKMAQTAASPEGAA